MAPLGLFITNLGGLGAPYAMGDTGASTVIVDYLFEAVEDPGAPSAALRPIKPIPIDNNSMWDVDTSSGDYEPEATADLISEGYWETGPSAGEMQPIDM